MVRMIFRGFAGMLLLTAGLTAPAEAQRPPAVPPPPIVVLGSDKSLEVQAEEGEDSAIAHVAVLNPGPEPVDVTAELAVPSNEAVSASSATVQIPSRQARRVEVTFSGLSEIDERVTAQLLLDGPPGPVSQGVEILPALDPAAPWSEVLIFGSLFLALALALAVVGSMPGNDREKLSNPAPGPKWEFDSWATTLTGIGALFGVVLAEAAFPEVARQVDEAELVRLNVLFGVLVVLGPFLFHALRRGGISQADDDFGRTGTNLTLLISCSVTLWAVLGQLGAFGLLGWELVGGGSAGWVIVLALMAIAVLALRYFFLTLSGYVTRSWSAAANGLAAAANRPIDVRDVDELEVRSAYPLVALAEDLDHGRAAVTLVSPAAEAPRSWALP